MESISYASAFYAGLGVGVFVCALVCLWTGHSFHKRERATSSFSRIVIRCREYQLACDMKEPVKRRKRILKKLRREVRASFGDINRLGVS